MTKAPLFAAMIALLLSNALLGEANEPSSPSSSAPYWSTPAATWNEALPIGNGRSGAMVFGGTAVERLQLNELSLWARSPTGRGRKPAPDVLGRARSLWFAGDIRACQDLMQREFMTTDLDASHQTAGELLIGMEITEPIRDYRRDLALNQGCIVTTTFATDATNVKRVSRMTPWTIETQIEQSGFIKPLVIELARKELHNGGVKVLHQDATSMTLLLDGQARNGEFVGVRYATLVRVVVSAGSIAPVSSDETPLRTSLGIDSANGRAIRVTGSATVDVSVATATDFDGHAADVVASSLLSSRDIAVKDSAVLDAMRERREGRDRDCFIRIGALGASDASEPVPALLERAKRGEVRNDLTNHYLAFCRHLIESASRSDPETSDLPANLQGLWNEHLLAPWNADYHTNINLQMNYWSAEQMGLGSRVEALTDYLDRLALHGRGTAQSLYAAGGWVCHHTSDPWGMTYAMGQTVWGLWPHGGGWLVRHCWEHYCYTLDRAYLASRAFPLMRGASEFYLDWLTEDPATGKLVGGPSTSPENTFLLSDGSRADVGMGNAMDQEIIWDCLTNLVDAARVLGQMDDPVVVRARATLERLAWPIIGSDGRLQEWSRPFEEAEPGHRHVSHLYAIYPSRQFMSDDTATYRDAARKSLAKRLAHGGGHTGWSRAWLINLEARLRDGDAAHQHFVKLLGHSTLPNLFDDHPPFQIDGNFGGLAGVCEMLLQSHEMRWEEDRPSFVLDLLPALPKAWPDGRATLCARGGVLVAMEWAKGALTEVTLTSAISAPLPDVLHLRLPAGTALPAVDGGRATQGEAADRITIRREGTASAYRLRWSIR